MSETVTKLQYNMYKPRKTGGGCAIEFSDTATSEGLMFSIAPQKGSEDKAFDWDKKLIIKLNAGELGSIISLFNGVGTEVKLFHKWKETSTAINVQKSDKQPGFVVFVNRGDIKFAFGIGLGEVEVLKVLFKRVILDTLFVQFIPKAKA